MKRIELLALGLSLAVCGLAVADDWPQFRGSRCDGIAHSARVPVRLAERHVRWKLDLPGRGLSSPIIVGERLFVTAASGSDQQELHVICFHAISGERLWERRFWATGRTMTHKKTSVAAPTPASDGRRLYALFSSNDLFCLDLDGNLVWLRGLTRDYPNASNSLGMASSPVVVDGVLIVQVENDSESFAAGMDVDGGTNLWKLERPRAANWSSPTLLEGESGRTVVALQSSQGIHAVDPKSGSLLWHYDDGAATIPSSVTSENRLYIPSHGLTALMPGGSGNPPKQLWRSGRLRPAMASPVIVGGRIFTVNGAGVMTAGALANGERLWQIRLKGAFSATPIGVGRHLYLVNEEGLLQVVDTSVEEGEVVGSFEFGDTILGTPSVAHDSLYVRSDSHLWRLSGS